ncbi:MAG: molecular chaperone HtpG [Spirochaetia bacterium]
MSKKPFKAEVDRLLKLIIHSLYSHHEIFLRELISNASDALDKMKLLTLTDEHFKGQEFVPQIDIELDENNHTLLIRDNGIGMSLDELNKNLGQIAHSGTAEFLEKLSGDSKKDSNLIGQFGVGFYSVFMVAKTVRVTSLRAGETQAHFWESDGETGYTVNKSEFEGKHGTSILITLTDEQHEYATRWRVQNIIETYSNHIAFPIFLHYLETKFKGEGENREEYKEQTRQQVNSAQALWTRSKSDLSEKDYMDFYHTIGHDTEDPLMYMHTKAEGSLEYTTLFYVPQKASFDLFQANYQPGVKLYVKRVFITDDDKELLPAYLRFVKGVIDSQDLPLNVSREILQQNRILSNIRGASIKKLLSEFKKLAETDKEKFKTFVTEYNRILKEGLYNDHAHREDLLAVIRFKSTAGEEWTSLAEYKDRMSDEQKDIYYLIGQNEQVVRSSPLLAAYKKKGFEVLLLTDDIDEFVIPLVRDFDGKQLKAINLTENDELFDDKEGAIPEDDDHKQLLEKLKKLLEGKVQDVRYSKRLEDVPACIVNSQDALGIQMQRMFKVMGQDSMDVKPVLELNAQHPVVDKILKLSDEDELKSYGIMLLDTALLAEGILPKDPHVFADLVFKKI